MSFIPNRHFRREYDRIFQKDPTTANVFLLLAELADEKGQIVTDEFEIQKLMVTRFNDPKAYQLSGGLKR